jgi:excisionase family DNA binding protein
MLSARRVEHELTEHKGSKMSSEAPLKRLTYTVDETAKILNIGRGQTYAGVRSGEIPSIKIGKRYLVPVVALERMLQGDPARTD